MISSSQRPLLDSTQHKTHIHAIGGIRTHNLCRRATADLRLMARGRWDRKVLSVSITIAYGYFKGGFFNLRPTTSSRCQITCYVQYHCSFTYQFIQCKLPVAESTHCQVMTTLNDETEWIWKEEVNQLHALFGYLHFRSVFGPRFQSGYFGNTKRGVG